MKVNIRNNVMTFEGGKAQEVNPYQRLKRTILACMLFEDNFYEDGIKAADRISELSKKCTFDQLSELILECSKRNLHHITLQMIVEALKKKDCEKPNFFKIIDQVIIRPDMMTDLLALYWKEGKKPLANQLKKGLAKAFTKFDRHQLCKYKNG